MVRVVVRQGFYCTHVHTHPQPHTYPHTHRPKSVHLHVAFMSTDGASQTFTTEITVRGMILDGAMDIADEPYQASGDV